MKIFTWLNLHGFEEYHESFSVNILELHKMVLFKYFKCKAPQKFSGNNYIRFVSAKV